MQNSRVNGGVKIRVGAVQEAAVIPHQDIIRPPAMTVDEPVLRRVLFQAGQESASIGNRPTLDVRCVFAHKEALAACIRMDPNQRVTHRGRIADLFRGRLLTDLLA